MRYYVFLKSSFKHTPEECESKRAYVFFALFYCLLETRSGECNVCILVCFVLRV